MRWIALAVLAACLFVADAPAQNCQDGRCILPRRAVVRVVQRTPVVVESVREVPARVVQRVVIRRRLARLFPIFRR